jgi:hypothetical protein
MAAWHPIRGRWWIAAIPIAVFSVVGAALILFHDAATPLSPGNAHGSLLHLGILFLVGPWVALLWVLLATGRGRRRERRLVEHGIRGTAVLESVRETGLRINEVPQLEMELLVTCGEGPPRRVRHQAFVGILDLHRCIPGATLDVAVNPGSPDDLLVRFQAHAPSD